MSDNIYKPIRLTKGKEISYQNLLSKVPTGNKEIQAKVQGPSAELAKFGIKGETTITYKRDKDGNLVRNQYGQPITVSEFRPTEVPEWFTHGIAVLNGQAPCYFEGCQEVVDAYKRELQQMQSRPGGCTECAKGALLRRHVTHFQNALPPEEANKLAKPTVPPYTLTNMVTHETVNVPRHQVPYATIRREIPKSMRDAFTIKAKESKLYVNGQEVPIEPILQQVQHGTTGAAGTTEKPSAE